MISIDGSFIIPLTIDPKTSDLYTFTPKRRHKHRKSHITHKVYKKPKSSSSKSSSPKSNNSKSKTKTTSRTKNKSRSSRKNSSSLIDLL